MANAELILEIVKKNNGVITSAEVTKAGISRGSLKHLVDTGELEHASRGVYQLPHIWDDEMFHLQVRYKKGIFSGETALFLSDLTDRTPKTFFMTFPLQYNVDALKKENVNCTRTKKEWYELGVIETYTPAGNLVKSYNMERTLCDILKKHNRTDIQVISEAFKRYTKRKDKNIPLISEYAKNMNVEKRLRSYLEVLL